MLRVVRALPRAVVRAFGYAHDEPHLVFQRVSFARHAGVVYSLGENASAVGSHSGLVKNNWVVSNEADPTGFRHLIVRIHHPGKLDLRKPLIILIPGMLCNKNLFCIPNDGRDFRDMNAENSFANQLALLGHEVVILNRRDSRWIIKRYVEEKLKIPQPFSEAAVDILMQVADLEFLIDAAACLSTEARRIDGERKVVVAGFSYGGIKQLHIFAFSDEYDPRIVGQIPMAVPVTSEGNRDLQIRTLKLYARMARILPFEYFHAINLAARNLDLPKGVLKRLAEIETHELAGRTAKAALAAPFRLSPALHSPNISNEAIYQIARYVLEPQAEAVREELLYMIGRGELVRRDTGERYLDKLRERRLPPALVVRGTEDRLVTEQSHRALREALGSGTQEALIDGAGHVDLVTGKLLGKTVEAVDEFVSSLN